MTTNGKGSLRRGTSQEELRRYAEGWERVFGKGKKRKPRQQRQNQKPFVPLAPEAIPALAFAFGRAARTAIEKGVQERVFRGRGKKRPKKGRRDATSPVDDAALADAIIKWAYTNWDNPRPSFLESLMDRKRKQNP